MALSSFQHTADTGFSLLVERNFNAIVNLVFADIRGRLVVADVAVETSSSEWSRFMRPIAPKSEFPFFDG